MNSNKKKPLHIIQNKNMEKQTKKLNDKIIKISSKITSENIKNKINEIFEKFNNKEIKYQQANRLINDQNNLFKVNKKINKIMKKFKLNKKQAMKKYINDENKKIKKRETDKFNKKLDNEYKKITDIKYYDETKELEKINKKIKKYEEKQAKLMDIKLNPENFIITMKPYKARNSKNDEKDLNFKDKNYREASNYDQTFYVELPKDEYRDNDFFILDYRTQEEKWSSMLTAGFALISGSKSTTIDQQISDDQMSKNYLGGNALKLFEDLRLYDNEKNSNNDLIDRIMQLLSDENIVIKLILNIVSEDTQIINKKRIIIDEEEVFGDIENNRDVMIYNKFVDLKLNENNEFISIYNNEYLNNNYNNLSCLFTIILEWKDYFELGLWNQGRPLFKTQPKFTYEGLLNYIYPYEQFIKGKSLKSTLKDFEKFFYAFGIQVKVYDIYKKELYNFEGIKINRKIPNNPLYLLYHNNHLQKISDIASFSHIVNNIQNNYNNKIISLEKVNFNYKTASYNEFIIINNTDDIFINLQKYSNSEEDIKINFVCFDTLNNILFDLYNNHKIQPYIKTNGTIIKFISFSYKNNDKKNINVMIKQYQHNGHLYDDNINEINKLNKIQELQTSVSKKLLNYKFISTYNDKTFSFIHYYRPKPIIKRYNIDINKNISYFDISKAYPSELLKINTVPIFTLFNYPKKYNNENINDYYIYLIEILDENDLIFYEKYTIIYGYNLKQIKINYKIIQFLEYTYLEKIDTKDILDEIFNIEDSITEMVENKDKINCNVCMIGECNCISLPKSNILKEDIINEKNRKFIANNNIGLLGKYKHIKETSQICNTERQAQHLVKEYGGSYYKLNDAANNNYLYFHVKKEFSRYKNGFLFFHMMIYDNMRTTLYNISNELKENNFNIYGIKTDAIYFESKNIKSENINKILDKFGNIKDEEIIEIDENKTQIKNFIRENIGKLKYVKYTNDYDTIHMFDCLKGIINNKFEDYSVNINIKEINIKDEYNIDEIENKTIMTAVVPGAGKSYACKKFLDKNNYKGLFVINNNNLAMEIKKEGYNSITPYQLLGLNIFNENNENIKKFNIEDYDVIIFEEIYFNEFKLLHKLYDFMLNNNDKIFIANGDPNQLECCQDVISINKKIDLVNIMFPNFINLKIIKRCDSDIFYKIKKLIDLNKNENNDNDLIEFIVNHFFKNKLIKDISDIKTGISYTNETKTIMNSKIHKSIYGVNNYIIGQKLIAKDYYKFKDGNKLYRNYEYILRNINNNIYTFEDEYSKTLYQLEDKLFNKYLDHSYIKTCHSSQGITLKDKYIIYDWKYSYCSIKWLWVAITRCNNIDNIYFYNGEDNINSLKNDVNINSYKQQDKQAKREFKEKDFVDLSWVSQQLKKQKYQCAICQDVINKLSINRLDNNLPHIKNNCSLTCLLCNVRAK